jgi:hypothetical protein
VRRALFFFSFLVGGACSFAAIDKIGKRCVDSCDPYACVDHVCVPRDAAIDTSMPDAEAGPREAGPCELDPMDDGGTIVFKDCFDDRLKAAGLGTPWPNTSGSPQLDDAESTSPPMSVEIADDAGTTAFIASATLKGDGGTFNGIRCSMMVRMDAISDTLWMMNVAIAAAGGESLSMLAYPSGSNTFTWYLYYQHANLADSSVRSAIPRAQWQKFTLDISASGIAAEFGASSAFISAGPTAPISSFRLQIGPYQAPANGGLTMHVDDVVCSTH